MTRHKTSDPRFELWERRTDGHRSLHTGVRFAPGDVLVRFAARATYSAPAVHTVQMNETDHILLNPGFLEYTNHGCAPNVVFDVERMTITAIEPIEPGDEIRYFYPSTEISMAHPFDCDCDSAHCLGVIRGAAHIATEVLERYHLAGHIRHLIEEREPVAGETAA